MSISNLGFAAYLVLKGYKISCNPSKDEKGKFIFIFDIDQDKYDKLFCEYCNSGYSKFDNIIVNLKKMLPRY